jgi:hypothetical protein
VDTKTELLERDMRLARVKLAEVPGDLAELEAYAESYTRETTADWHRQKLNQRGWILGPSAILPKFGHVADRFVSLTLKHKLASESELLGQYEKELQRRALSKGANDVMALNMLAHLLSGSGVERFSDLADVDQAGWDRYHDSRFAASLLTCQHGMNELKSGSPQFLKARKDFPEDAHIAFLGVQMAQSEKKPLLQPLIAAIKAEFRHLSISRGTIKDSYRLKSLFALLEEELRKQI